MSKSPVALLYDHVNSRFMKYLQDGTDSLLGVVAKLRNAAGTVVNPATEDTLAGVKTNQESIVDTGNSTTAQLAADAVFTGTSKDVLGYHGVIVDVHSDKDSAEDGLEFQSSQNGSDWVTFLTTTINAAVANAKTFRPPIKSRYFRLKYTNGDTLTTELRIQTILFRNPLSQTETSDGETVGHDHHGVIIGGTDDDRHVRFARIDEDRDLRVMVADDPAEPIFVTMSTGGRSYYHINLVNIDEPASILSGVDGPYDVGGDTFTISVNGGANQTPTFPTRTARAGVHYSAPHPRTANPDHEKLKVSIDGGALVEVKIGKGWTTGADIAAQLQIQIRALVPNGTNATVEYDTTEYPFRYVFKSGTTGASSTMHVEKGGDDLAKKVLFVDIQFGGTELPGLAADYYFTNEVVEFLSGVLTDVAVSQTGDRVKIRTVAAGVAATLQVTAGGANTALQFPTTLTTGVTGSGDDDMAVDGSTTAVRYAVDPPVGRKFVVQKLIFFARDDGVALNKFAGRPALTNGLLVEIQNENLPLIPTVTATTSADLMSQADDAEIIDNGWASNGQDLLKAVFDYSPGLTITSITNFIVTIQDNLIDMEGAFYVRAVGWVEEAA